MKYKAVLFDLDDTIFDRDRAIKDFGQYLYTELKPNVDKDIFIEKFYSLDNHGYSNKKVVVNELNNAYTLSIEQEWYFDVLTKNMGISAEEQKSICKIFHELHKRKIKTGVITNGTKVLQRTKIRNLSIESLVDVILISDEIGIKKPDKRIFEYAIQQINVENKECIFVGDNIENDVKASINCGMHGILFKNHLINEIDDTIESIDDLKDVFKYF